MPANTQLDKYRRISKIGAVFMVSTAAVFDLLEVAVDWIPFLGQAMAFLIDLTATISFSIWFMASGVKLGNPKTAAKFWGTNIAELLPIPVVDFCLTTIGIILTIRQTWKDDSGDTSGDLADAAKLAKAVATKKIPT